MPTETTMETGPRVLYCDCAYSSIIPRGVKEEVRSLLGKSGAAVTAVPDLCAMSARRDPELARLADASSLTIIACFPRAVHGVFRAAGVELPESTTFLNMRTTAPEAIGEALGVDVSNDAPPLKAPRKEGDWIPWFPVIDRDRCTDCNQCTSFCLFGVFGNDKAGKVTIENPTACKANCPACARVCPEAAIIFPKLTESPINGDEIRDEDAVREMIKLNTEAMMGDDIYQTLANRRKRSKVSLFKEGAAPGSATPSDKGTASPGSVTPDENDAERQAAIEQALAERGIFIKGATSLEKEGSVTPERKAAMEQALAEREKYIGKKS